MREMSVTEGLVELKLLSKRINQAISSANWCGVAKKASREIDGERKDSFMKKVKADYESVIALIKNRADIKSAIVNSNAETIVEIAGERMTVAEAIERKSSIEFEKSLLRSLTTEYSDAKNALVLADGKMENAIKDMSVSLAGSEKKNLGEEQEALIQAFRKANEMEIVDPLSIEKTINDLQERIDRFEANVDIVLSMSNAVTKITVE